MCCRIERLVVGEELIVFRVSGRIAPETVGTLKALVGQEPGRVAIDLNQVTLVDREAVKFFGISETNGIELRNCPAYVRDWISLERIATEVSGLEAGAGNDIDDLWPK